MPGTSNFTTGNDARIHGLSHLLLCGVHGMELPANRRFQRDIGLNIAAGGKLNIAVASQR